MTGHTHYYMVISSPTPCEEISVERVTYTIYRYFLTAPVYLTVRRYRPTHTPIFPHCVRKYTAGALYRDYFL